jgi:hypothetical protein
MNWIFPAQSIPGQDLAQQVLQANTLQAMQLVVALVVVGWVLSTWMNGRAVSQMSSTQREMSTTNGQVVESSNRQNQTLQSTVDEIKLFRQDFATRSLTQQTQLEQTKSAVEAHEEKAEGRVKSIIDQVTAESNSIHGALKEAVNNVNASTREAVKPALEALDKLVLLSDTFDTRTEATRKMLASQHEEEMKFLQAQHEGHMRVLREHITQAQQAILDSLKKTEEKQSDEQPIQAAIALAAADPVPDDGSVTNVVGVGTGRG